MLDVYYTARFKKDFKRCEKQGIDTAKVFGTIDDLRKRKTLSGRMCDHALSGNYSGARECHILPDLLLIYRVDKERLVLTAVRLGSHSQLF